MFLSSTVIYTPSPRIPLAHFYIAKAYFKLLSEINETNVISVMLIGVHREPEKTKPPEGGLSPKKYPVLPGD